MKLPVYLLAILGVIVISAAWPVQQPAAAEPVLASADMRPSIDLGGAWTWSIDPFRDGIAGFHGSTAPLRNRRFNDFDVAQRMESDPGDFYEYDMDRSPIAVIPQSFLTLSPEMRYYNGLVWFQRHFTLHSNPQERLVLRFGAVDYRAHVYLTVISSANTRADLLLSRST